MSTIGGEKKLSLVSSFASRTKLFFYRVLIEDAKVKPAHSKLYPCPLFLSNFDLTMVYFLLPPKIEKREWRALKKAPSLFRLRIKSTRTDANASFSFTLRVHASKKFSQIEFRSRARTKKFFPLSRETEKKEGENLRATENEQKQTYRHRCDLVPASLACPKRTSCRERLESSLPSSFTRSRVVGRGSDRLLFYRPKFFFPFYLKQLII